MNTLFKRLAAPLAVASLIAAASPLAHAGSRAYSLLDVTNGSFFRADTGATLILGTDILIQDFSETANLTTAYNGGAGVLTTAEDTNAADGVDISPTAPAGQTLVQNCQGPGCGAAPDFPNPFTGGNQAAGEYARAAALIQGTGLDIGVVDTNTTQLVAEAVTQLGTTDNSLGVSNLANGTGFTVTFTVSEDVAVGFTADIFQEVFSDLDPGIDGVLANAKTTFGFSVEEIGVGFLNLTNTLPTLNTSQNNPANPPSSNTRTDIGFSTQTQTALVAGSTYQFTLAWGTEVNLETVALPEPAPLALLSLGLLAVPMARRWKARS